MFEYYNNTLCIKGNSLAEIGVTTLSSLKVLAHRGKIKKARSARGLGSCALYVYSTLPERFKNIIEHELGIDPYEESSVIKLSDYLKPDETALAYFSNYELEDGRYLSEANSEAVEEYTANACVLNALHRVIEKILKANPRINKAELWEKLAKSVGNIDADLRSYYPFDLPTNPRALRAKYESCILKVPNERYKRAGLEGLIHDNWCNKNSVVISSEIGKWLIAYYALPVKYSIPEVWKIYEENRSKTGFPRLSESSIQNFIMKPENERIWFLPRHGEEEYTKRYGHTLKKNKSVMFPNAHWAIDGTKLDAIHYWDNARKMASDMNIDVVVDVHSEKIIGWSFSETENHVDHFKAIKMAVNTAGARPYTFSYDGQSGHKMKKMQNLYKSLLAKGGKHYQHKVGRKSNPIEQIFDRLQQQVVNKRWFSDKQSIKSKRLSSKPNMDFVKEFKGALPTKEELYKHWIIMVDEWNSMKHPHQNKSRNEVYATDTEFRQELESWDQISLFWLEEDSIKYTKDGLRKTNLGTDYWFEVYDKDNQVDIEFRRKYVNQKMIVSYDPEYLDGYVKLSTLNEKNEKVFVAYAQKKRQHTDIPMFTTKESKEQMRKDMQVRDLEKMRDWDAYQRIAEETGITREKLVDEQNDMVGSNWEFEAKYAAYATKPEQIQTNRKVKIM